MFETVALHWYEWGIIAVYFLCLSFIFAYSLVQLNLVWHYFRRNQDLNPILDQQTKAYPFVTVQLPLYNERYVAQRLIDAVASLDYPYDRLEIQVLDDSTDDTSNIVDEAASVWRKLGVDIQIIRRENRSGYKAGALAYGTELARGEFIAIFDADFLPHPDFLKSTVPHFNDDSVGVVQVRWEHLNKNFSMLTRMQAFGLDAHFTVEQGGRNASGCFINFNGTAGIWRKACIEDAGGWSSDTLTEDLDLSYRAQLKGWRFVYREDIGAPAELPAAMNALKTQQFRWTKGAAECMMKNLKHVWKQPEITLHTKVHALFHLMNSFIFICVIVAALLSIPMLFIKSKLMVGSWLVTGGSVFLLSVGILFLFYWVGYRRLHRHASFTRFTGRFLLFLSMSMGLSLHNALAVAEGYLGRKTPFLRTPKFNLTEQKDHQWIKNVYLNRSVGMLTVFEIALGVLFGFAAFKGIMMGDYGLFPFHVMLSFGFLLVGGYSAKHALSMVK